MLPIGRRVTGRRVHLLHNFEIAIAGNLRAASVLQSGEYIKDNVISLMERASARIERDPRHIKKVQAARSRYSDVDEAR
jgi:sugar (pentulose or hexulose) kinase